MKNKRDLTGIKELDKLINDGTKFILQLKTFFEVLGNSTQLKDYKQDPYKILGVTKDMHLKDIEEIYRKLVLIYHPDKGKTDTEKIKEINNAWEAIKKERGR